MRIYLDHCATTPLHPRVLAAMTGVLTEFGNPSTLYQEGRLARQKVEASRAAVASLFGAPPACVVFTSGGTESNNAALCGWLAWSQHRGLPAHVVTTPMEHPSVLKTLTQGSFRPGGPGDTAYRLTLLPVDPCGRLDPQDLRRVLQKDPACLVAISYVNHELGNVFPVSELARIAHESGAVVHCDAVQAAGKCPIDVTRLGVDSLSISAHKFYGPKGIGALLVTPPLGSCQTAPLLPSFLLGGPQERGQRAGTENVPAIVGFGECARVAQEELLPTLPTLLERRRRLENGLLRWPGTRLFGDPLQRSPIVCNVGFEGVGGDLLLASLDLEGIAVSTGAACSSGGQTSSAVLRALGVAHDEARQAVRFSIGRDTTAEQIDQTIACVGQILERIRSLGPPP